MRVIVAGGHPGDPEAGCGGTIALYADTGHTHLFGHDLGDPLPHGVRIDRANIANIPRSLARESDLASSCPLEGI